MAIRPPPPHGRGRRRAPWSCSSASSSSSAWESSPTTRFQWPETRPTLLCTGDENASFASSSRCSAAGDEAPFGRRRTACRQSHRQCYCRTSPAPLRTPASQARASSFLRLRLFVGRKQKRGAVLLLPSSRCHIMSATPTHKHIQIEMEYKRKRAWFIRAIKRRAAAQTKSLSTTAKSGLRQSHPEDPYLQC
jgi:hypothetical protein